MNMTEDGKKPVIFTSIRDVLVNRLYKTVTDYSDWYDEHGLHLPPDYAIDPAGYCEALHKIKRAFTLLYEDMHGIETGELWRAKHEWEKYGEKDAEKIKELENEIEEGMNLFGKQLYHLVDPKNGVAPGH